MYAATPRVLITGWLDGVSLTTLLDGRTELLPAGWRELDRGEAADLAARLLSHAIYAPAACAGWMHADLHPGNFLLLPGGRLGMLDFGAVAATPGGIPVPFGQFAAAVLAGDGAAAISLARQVGALAAGAEVDPQLVIELLHPLVATAAADQFTYSRPWLRKLMAHLGEARFARTMRKLTPARDRPVRRHGHAVCPAAIGLLQGSIRPCWTSSPYICGSIGPVASLTTSMAAWRGDWAPDMSVNQGRDARVSTRPGQTATTSGP